MKGGATEDRERDYRNIIQSLTLKPVIGEPLRKKLHGYEVVVWAGDTNSRLMLSKSLIGNVLHKIGKGVDGLNDLLLNDELKHLQNQKRAFHTFKEAAITFPPTYKYIVNGEGYDTGESGKVRVPSWCDRVLFRGPVSCRLYEHRPGFNQSDHKPVVALLQIESRPPRRGQSHEDGESLPGSLPASPTSPCTDEYEAISLGSCGSFASVASTDHTSSIASGSPKSNPKKSPTTKATRRLETPPEYKRRLISRDV